jgi:excisionase family DNA binding protein
MNNPLERLEAIVVRLERHLSQPQQKYFSIKQAAVFTGLSEKHIRRTVVGGMLPCSNVGTADRPTYRISREAIRDWMKEREAGPKPPTCRRKQVESTEQKLTFSPFVRPSKYRKKGDDQASA